MINNFNYDITQIDLLNLLLATWDFIKYRLARPGAEMVNPSIECALCV